MIKHVLYFVVMAAVMLGLSHLLAGFEVTGWGAALLAAVDGLSARDVSSLAAGYRRAGGTFEVKVMPGTPDTSPGKHSPGKAIPL